MELKALAPTLCEWFLTLVYIVTYLLQPRAPDSSRSSRVEGRTCQPAAVSPQGGRWQVLRGETSEC